MHTRLTKKEINELVAAEKQLKAIKKKLDRIHSRACHEAFKYTRQDHETGIEYWLDVEDELDMLRDDVRAAGKHAAALHTIYA